MNSKLTFGGSLLNPGTNPKTARPLATKLPIHLVLRATKSTMRLPKNFRRVDALVTNACRRRGVRLYEYANVGNHLHLLIKLPRRAAWAQFIRELTGRIASETGVAWLHRPFTRVIKGWAKAYATVKAYLAQNRWEADHGARRGVGRIVSLAALASSSP